MGDPSTGAGEQLDAVLVELYAMGVPDVVADPAQVFGVLGRGHAELLAAVGDVTDVLGKVGVQRDPVLAGEYCGLAHQVAADREGRAGRHDHAQHRAMAGVVVVLDQTLGLFENMAFFLNHRVGRQAALATAHAHAPACGVKAHADLCSGMDAVVQLAAVGVDIQMVTGSGAARENQLGHRRLGRNRDHFRRESRPDWIQVVEPIEQLAVLGCRYNAGQALVHMVVGVDQPRDNHLAGHVQNHVGLLRQGFAGADLLDQVVFDKQAAAPDFPAFTIHCDQQFCVLDQ